MHDVSSQERRWETEAAFFDSVEYNEAPYPEATLKRYLELKKPYHQAECFYSVMGNLKGKRILDIGCGSGDTSLVLAAHGARVLGIDISPKAIESARRRAGKHKFSNLLEFACAPLEKFVESRQERYDIICGNAILHHLLPVLGDFLSQAKKLAHPNTQFVFMEPVATSPFLRKVRMMLPIKSDATPDERPLNLDDLRIITDHFPNLQIRYFNTATRVAMPALRISNYEMAPPLVRGLYDASGLADKFMLQTLGMRALASVAVLYTPIQN